MPARSRPSLSAQLADALRRASEAEALAETLRTQLGDLGRTVSERGDAARRDGHLDGMGFGIRCTLRMLAVSPDLLAEMPGPSDAAARFEKLFGAGPIVP